MTGTLVSWLLLYNFYLPTAATIPSPEEVQCEVGSAHPNLLLILLPIHLPIISRRVTASSRAIRSLSLDALRLLPPLFENPHELSPLDHLYLAIPLVSSPDHCPPHLPSLRIDLSLAKAFLPQAGSP